MLVREKSRTFELPKAGLGGVVPVAAVVPLFLAGANQHYKGTTATPLLYQRLSAALSVTAASVDWAG